MKYILIKLFKFLKITGQSIFENERLVPLSHGRRQLNGRTHFKETHSGWIFNRQSESGKSGWRAQGFLLLAMMFI